MTSFQHPNTPEQEGGWTTKFMCPFCGSDRFGPHELCGGSFLDVDHPSAVRPILVDVTPEGKPAEGTAQRLNEAKATYHR